MSQDQLRNMDEDMLRAMLQEYKKRLDELFIKGDTESTDFYYCFNLVQRINLELELRQVKKEGR